uniref:Glyoxalase/fosfomycin resistance/dioxygenase domain-containing protein n=1 Tax=Romanomermis culicivorax TaxID=13658 RepID=A0A915IEM3_ROMCU
MLSCCNRSFRKSPINLLRNFGTKVETIPKNFPKTWTVGKLNHVAIACPDLEKASNFYKNILNATVSEPLSYVTHGLSENRKNMK